MIHFDLPTLNKRILEIDNYMTEPTFWDDVNRAQQVSQESKVLKDKIQHHQELKNRLDDNEILLELIVAEEEDTSNQDLDIMVKDLKKDLLILKNEIESLRIKTLLSEEYDGDNAFITLHAGAGGTDAQDWTQMLMRMYTRWCEGKGFKVQIVDMLQGDEAGIKSVNLKIEGEFAYGYLKTEKGIHRLVRISPFNSAGKRQTSFASMEVLPELTETQDIEIRPEDLRVDTYRASGAGGQYVNKTESAIRITHLATGIVVQCQNERSQHSNKETAMKMLKYKLAELKERAHKEKIEDLTGELKEIGWGSQIRSYTFQSYTLVKDHRTGAESGNINAVMDGDIDLFINEYLKFTSK